ncbi:ABC transporter ATP-binding protein [Marinicrinis sediminis]|uniref:ABC transporter ATP-binding protein n=1 Tax=Marinicrinis sediminis TaxID=1652465 RepID=A0ABW5RGP4_9BACL
MEDQDKGYHIHIESAGYEKKQPILTDLSFHVSPGEMIGLIGPNGAGKSTAIKAMLGRLPYLKGTSFAQLSNLSHSSPLSDLTKEQEDETEKEPVSWSYIPEHPVYYDHLTLWEHFELMAALHRLSPTVLEERGNQLLKQYRLQAVKHHYPASFSKGMRQKMMLMLGLIIRPDLYLIDEPFIGLDPRGMHLLLEQLQEEQKRGAGILLCTHVLDTAERICSRFVLLHQGSLLAQGTLDDLRERCQSASDQYRSFTLSQCFHYLTEEMEEA